MPAEGAGTTEGPRSLLAAAPSTPLFFGAELAYAMLFGKDGDTYQNGLGGVFSLGYALSGRLGLVVEAQYATFTQRGLVPGRLEFLSVAAGARFTQALGARAALTLGATLGLSTFGVRGLADAGGLAVGLRCDLSVSLARTLQLTVGLSPALAAGPTAGTSFYLPLRAGLTFLL